MAELTIREKQCLFVELDTQLRVWVLRHPGWRLRLAEGYVGDSVDKPGEDTPHQRAGQHFRRLAQDYILEVAGVYKAQDCPEWQAIGAHWKTLHPLCRWGGDFLTADGQPKLDVGHFSLAHLGHA